MNAYFIILSLFLFNSISALAVTNVCSITINSDDEIKTLKSIYSDSSQFKYYELTAANFAKPVSEASPSYQKIMFRLSSWFKNACDEIEKQKIESCDVVLISGHYADVGSFYGSREIYFNEGLKLPLQQLEYYSFSNKCKAFFQKPKEVYLFGCQTLGLTGLMADSSTPFMDQFAKNTGYRMSQVFPNAAIMGFKGLAPIGIDVAPSFKNYLNLLSKDRFNKSVYEPQKTLQTWNQVMSKLGLDKYGDQRSHQILGVQLSNNKNDLIQFEHYRKDTISVYQSYELNKLAP